MSSHTVNHKELDATGETSNELTLNDAENLPKKKPVSDRKVEANRRNAQKSAGPTTAIGKQTVARNAIKHGLFTRELIIRDPDSKETQEEFDGLRDSISEYYKPLGFLEEFWVSKLASCIWRSRRLLRYESGNVAKSLAQYRFNLHHPILNLENVLDHPLSNSEIDSSVDHLSLPPRPVMDLVIRME